MYVYSGFYVIFLTVLFCDFAPRTSRPELWAGLGRAVRSFAVAAVVPSMPWLYDAWGSTAVGGPWAGGPELRRGGGGAVHAPAL